MRRWIGRTTGSRLGGIGFAALVALAGCDNSAYTTPPPAPPVSTPAPEPVVAAQSDESRALEAYYARVQTDLKNRGLLRVDGGGPDTPYTETQLVENFIRIALFEEFTNIGGFLVAQQTASQLHRWAGPVRMSVRFGDSVPLPQRRQDRDAVSNYAARLARLTGLPITLTSNTNRANFHVFVVNEDERRSIGQDLRAIIPDISQNAINTVQNMPRTTFCLVFARDPGNDGTYTQAVAVIRGEHPELLRLSCLHEELAQGLGLSNDSPTARPSIFNDDEEFGLLTGQDELLLRMLYDRRLRAGMNAAQARPIAEQIAADILNGT